jgi:hypothetical protein
MAGRERVFNCDQSAHILLYRRSKGDVKIIRTSHFNRLKLNSAIAFGRSAWTLRSFTRRLVSSLWREIFCPKPSIAEPGSEEDDDRSQLSTALAAGAKSASWGFKGPRNVRHKLLDYRMRRERIRRPSIDRSSGGMSGEVRHGPATLNATVSALIFWCPTTRQEIKSGVHTDEASLAKVRSLSVQVYCPACKTTHLIRAGDGWVGGDAMGELPLVPYLQMQETLPARGRTAIRTTLTSRRSRCDVISKV